MHYSACMATTERADLLGELGARVRRLRAERGATAREIAQRAGLSLRFYSQLERGEANIAFTRLVAVAGALGVDAGALATGIARASSSRPIVALVGLRGAGKSTVGRLLAEGLAVP